MDGDQGGGAAGLDADAGAAKVELVRHPGRHEVLVVAEGALEGADALDQALVGKEVVVQVGALPHPGVHAGDGGLGVGGTARVLEGPPGAFEEEAVLRVEHLRFARGEPEEAEVEVADALQGAERLHVGGIGEVLGGHAGGEQFLVGEEPDGFHAAAHVVPELLQGLGARDAQCHPDDRDGVGRHRIVVNHRLSPVSRGVAARRRGVRVPFCSFRSAARRRPAEPPADRGRSPLARCLARVRTVG